MSNTTTQKEISIYKYNTPPVGNCSVFLSEVNDIKVDEGYSCSPVFGFNNSVILNINWKQEGKYFSAFAEVFTADNKPIHSIDEYKWAEGLKAKVLTFEECGFKLDNSVNSIYNTF